jgi:hypothetical protein
LDTGVRDDGGCLCFGAAIPLGDVLPLPLLLVGAEHCGSRDDRVGGRTRDGAAGLLMPRDRAGSSASGAELAALPAFSTTSKRLDLRFFCVRLLCRRKYFWAWLATCVGVRVVTKCREMPRQSPFPSFSRPARNRRCSSSVHGTPDGS